MSNQIKVDILKYTFVGLLDLEIEGLGKMRIEGIGEPLCMLAAQVEVILNRSDSMQINIKNHPYEFVSFDREQAKLVVRKKTV